MIETPSAAVRRRLRELEGEVRAGRMDLVAVVDAALADLDEPRPLCLRCTARPAEVHRVHGPICRVCLMRAFRDGYDARVLELEAKRAADVSKKDLQRLRDEIEPDRPRGRAPFRVCQACGDRLPARERHPEDYCVACLDIHESRGKETDHAHA